MKKILATALASGCMLLSADEFIPQNMKDITNFLKSEVDSRNTPSIQYIFFDEDTVIYELRYGVKDVQAHAELDQNSVYHLFSITKTFTAVAILQLVEEQKLRLEDPVHIHLADFPYGKDVEVQHLLNHTGGIPNPMPLRWIHLEEEHAKFDRSIFFREVFKSYPNVIARPGTKFQYSNLGYVLLGQIIENVAGISYEEYIVNKIIKRIEVSPSDLSFNLDKSTHIKGYQKKWSLTNALLGFLFEKKKFMGEAEGDWKPFKHFHTNGTAYGGMFGTGRGLTCFGQALLKDESALLNGGLKQTLFRENVIQGKGTEMAMSWFTGELRGNRYVAHAGGGGGYYVELRLYPDLRTGSVIMFNRTGMTDQRVLDHADRFFITQVTNVSY